MRLIDADAFKRIICQDCGVKFIDTNCNADCHIIETINNMQTVEAMAASKVHGTWKGVSVGAYICSECLGISGWSYDFCPHCGADMRGVAT